MGSWLTNKAAFSVRENFQFLDNLRKYKFQN